VKLLNYTVIAIAAASLGGCAVSPSDVDSRAQQMRSQINDQLSAQSNVPKALLVERVRGTYLGGESVPLAYDATLPAIFSDVTLAFPGRTNLATVGERITEVTKLPVRLRPDVFITAKSLVRAGLGQSQGAGQPGPAPINPAVPPMPLPRAQGTNGAGIAAQTFDDFDVRLPMDYSGSLSGYLDLICARLGINWEYKDGTIILYRMVTKVIPVKVNPGSVDFASGLSKGGGGGDKGSFTSSSSTNMKGEYNVWTSIESAVKGMLSPLGTSTVDQAGGLLVITDTKEVVDNVIHYIDVENSTLTRQINISVRVVRVAITDSTEAGFDLNLIYKRLAAGATDWSFGMQAPSTLASSNAGALDLNILKPGNRFQGSDVLVKALNQFGNVLSDDTTTANTTNRVPVPVGKFSTTTYLAETKPASGGGTSGSGSGIPGLTPGTVTTGFFLNVLPTAFENNSVLLRVSLDQSVLTRLGSISTGSGETLQQIQTPEVDGTKSDHSVGLKDGESIVLMGISRDGSNGTQRSSVSGFSLTGSRTREVQLIVLTPKVSSGI
jgi:type IVB pilus formation R64 PilN family outer membrane protein